MTGRTFIDGKGHRHKLGKKLGSGAEGDVYAVESNSELVAKLYSASAAAGRAEKVTLMARHTTELLERFVAWPCDVLLDGPGGRVSGFLMRKASGRQLHDLYGPKSRLQYYPQAGWKFLVVAATNLARAVAAVNSQGHAVGDLNQRNVHVDERAVVTILDADSFHVRLGRREFSCGVGVDSHTPPELQGVPLGTVPRTANHDAFALAVSVFQLLFLGRHPFAGLSLAGDLSVAGAIRQGKFAYGPNAANRRMRQPLGTASIDIVPSTMADMFERAFTSQTRPTAAEWASTLERLAGSLEKCALHSGHEFRQGLTECPWCKLEIETAVIYWLAPVVTALPNFDFAGAWAAIAAVREPSPPAVASPLLIQPSSAAYSARRKILIARAWGGLAALLLASPVALSVPAAVALTFRYRGASADHDAQGLLLVLVTLIAGVAGLVLYLVEKQLRLPFAAALIVGRSRQASTPVVDAADGFLEQFRNLRRELERQKQEYERLPEVRAHRFQELANTVRQRALDAYLDKHRIIDATITNIGSSRSSTLLSYGIETALDVNASAIEAIPGFGPSLASWLVAWRRDLERRFVFDASRYDDSADRRRIDQEEARRTLQLRSELAGGAAKLKSIAEAAARQMELSASRRAEVNAELARVSADASTLPHPVGIAAVALAIAVLASSVQLGLYGVLRPNSATPPAPVPSIATAPAAPLAPKVPTAQDHYDLAISLVKQKKFGEAESELRTAVALDDTRADAWHELGYVLLRQKKYKDSAEASARAVGLDSKKAGTYRNLGLALSSLADWPKAIQAFAKAVELEPKLHEHHLSLAVALKKGGRLADARKELESVLLLKPDSADAVLELGRVCLLDDDTEGARVQLGRLEQLDPKKAIIFRREIDSAEEPE